MAVIQISRIQVRRGQASQSGLPQLASGEIGWAIDTQELYIGNGSVAEGAPFVGNTRILTENDLFSSISLSTPYVFSATNTLYTGVDANHPVTRSLQAKLDDSVSTRDFGVEPNTVVTNSFQNAILQIFLKSGKTNQPLRVPAGTYYVDKTIYIPKNTMLVGDGIGKTTIISQGTGTNSTIFRTIGGLTSNGQPIMDTSIQSSNQPTSILISGFTLKYSSDINLDESAPLIIIDGCENSEIVKNRFEGSYYEGISTTSTYAGIHLQGNLTHDIDIVDNEFENLTYPIYSDYDINTINIDDNKFQSLYQGITLAKNVTGSSPKQFGPRHVQIKNNSFKHIEREAIYAGYSTSTFVDIQSVGNTFIDVGDGNSDNFISNLSENQNDGNALTSIMTFKSKGTSSREDSFSRFEYSQTTVGQTKKQLPLIDGDTNFELKYARSVVLSATSDVTTLLNIPYPNIGTNIKIDYVINKLSPSRTRVGTLTVLSGNGVIVGTDPIQSIPIKDQYTYAGEDDTLVTFQANLSKLGNSTDYNSILIQYVNPFLTYTGTCVATLSAIW